LASSRSARWVKLDITDRNHFTQLSIVALGVGAGPHKLALTGDDSRLVVVGRLTCFDEIYFRVLRRLAVSAAGRRPQTPLTGRFYCAETRNLLGVTKGKVFP